jgi:hypothetical protein
MIAMTDADGLAAQLAALQQHVAELQEQVAQLTSVEPNAAEPRFFVALDESYHAPVTGFLSICSTSGWTGAVDLLVGWEDPPTECVGTADSRGGSGAYLGAVIREGEVFMLAKHGRRPAFHCVFTPFF